MGRCGYAPCFCARCAAPAQCRRLGLPAADSPLPLTPGSPSPATRVQQDEGGLLASCTLPLLGNNSSLSQDSTQLGVGLGSAVASASINFGPLPPAAPGAAALPLPLQQQQQPAGFVPASPLGAPIKCEASQPWGSNKAAWAAGQQQPPPQQPLAMAIGMLSGACAPQPAFQVRQKSSARRRVRVHARPSNALCLPGGCAGSSVHATCSLAPPLSPNLFPGSPSFAYFAPRAPLLPRSPPCRAGWLG